MPTIVNVDIRELSGEETGIDYAKAVVDFWPFRKAHIEDGGEDYLLSANILRVRVPDGETTVVLPPTPAGNAMWVQERSFKGASKYLVSIPDQSEVNLWDLPHLDPESLDPEAPLSPAWLEGLEAVQSDVETATETAADADSKATTAQVDATSALDGLALKADQTVLEAFAEGTTTAIGSLTTTMTNLNTALGNEITARQEFDATVPDLIDDALNAHTPGASLASMEVLATRTSSATTVTGAAALTGLTTPTIVGTGRPVDVEFTCPGIWHSVAASNVSIAIVGNNDPLGAFSQIGSVSAPTAAAGGAQVFTLKRRFTLVSGVSYSWSIRAYTFSVVGTATLVGTSPYQAIQLTVTAA